MDVLNTPCRCVNLDWLEVYCLEPVEHACDADYFISKGYWVEQREYGTRIYEEMFTIMGTDHFPLLEVRRKPKSSQTAGGLLPFNACHIRLVNRTCYYDNAAGLLDEFLHVHGIIFQRISRVDVCLDFERFDSGDWPDKFLKRYLQEKYSKINQARISNYGEDTWTSRRWDSISWGKEKSDVTTKLYNKTKQLAETKDKPYIKQAWFKCGIVDNPVTCEKLKPDGTKYQPVIWRVEFSVRSGVKGWFVIEPDGVERKKQSIRNTLAMWSGREQLLTMFSSLSRHYFRFKVFERDKRKDLCKDKVLFTWSPNEKFYHVERLASPADHRHDFERLLAKLNNFQSLYPREDIKQAVSVIASLIDEENTRRFLSSPFNRNELLALQQAIAIRLHDKDADPAKLRQAIIDFLNSTPDKPF